MARLGDVCTIVSGSTPKSNVPEYWDGDIKWITPAELDQGTYIINDSVRHITELGVAKTGLKPFPQGTVILSSRAPIGKTAIAGCEMYCNQGFKNLICSDKINPRYLYWFLTCNTEYLNSLGRGATFKEISKEIVANIEIPLPNMEQQLSIAEKFEKISKLIALRKEQLVKLDQLVKSRFIELSNEWGCEATPLQEFLDDITYGFTNPMPDAEEGPWKITAKDVVNGRINFDTARKTTLQAYEELTAKSKPDIGTVLLTKDGTLGRCAVVEEDGICVNQSVAVLKCNKKILPKFLAILLQMPEYQREMLKNAGGGTIKHIYITKVVDMMVMVPDVSQQLEFLSFVEQTDKSKLAIQQSLDKLELLKKSLMQEYFG